jgi:sugar transferase (PEP-CTERM/EpsH1 system associated)
MEELLYLAHRIPYPPNKGDKVRTFNELKYFSKRYRVHLGTFIDDPADWEHVEKVKEYCASVFFAPLNPKWARIRSAKGLFTGDALTLPYYWDSALARWVDGLVAKGCLSYAIAYSSSMAQYLTTATQLRRIANIADVDSDKWRQYAPTQSWPMSWVYAREATTLAKFERRLAVEFDATVLHAPHEAEFLRKMAPEAAHRVHHSSNGVDSDYFSPLHDFANPYTAGEIPLVFTGAMDYWPNIDAVEWFADEIYPLIRQAEPKARFYVVGARPAARLDRLKGLEGVTVTGGVPDVRPYLAHAALSVAPLRIARGIQNKVLEAMAMAKAVVVSPHAAAGITAQPDSELVIAPDGVAFASVVCRFLKDEARDSIGAAARARVLEDYSWHANLSRLEALMVGLQSSAPDQAVAPVAHS